MTTTINNKHKKLNVPNLRFPEFEGEWKEERMADIADLYKGTGISKDQLSVDGKPCILYGELYTIKEILSDNRVNIQHNEKDTLSKLISTICKAFRLNVDSSCPTEIRTIASSLINCCKAIEDIRSDKTIFHGKTDDNNIVENPLYAYFIVNSVSAIGLFLLSFYKEQYPKIVHQPLIDWNSNDLPF